MGDGASLAVGMAQIAYLMHTEGDIAAEAAKRPQPAMTPDRKIREALLRRAIQDLDMAFDGKAGAQLAKDARTWMLDDNVTWPFSFVRICDGLGLEPGYIRKQIAVLLATPFAQRVRFKRTFG